MANEYYGTGSRRRDDARDEQRRGSRAGAPEGRAKVWGCVTRDVVGGVAYDVRTSVRFATRSRNEGTECEYVETLFRTRSGSYFIHGIGLPESPYSCLGADGRRAAASRIVPVEPVAAHGWMRQPGVVRLAGRDVTTRPRMRVLEATRDAIRRMTEGADTPTADELLWRLATAQTNASDARVAMTNARCGDVVEYRPRLSASTLEALETLGDDIGQVVDFLVSQGAGDADACRPRQGG